MTGVQTCALPIFARLFSRPLSDGWLAGLTSSQRVPLRGKADSKRTGLVVVKLVGFAHL